MANHEDEMRTAKANNDAQGIADAHARLIESIRRADPKRKNFPTIKDILG